MSQLLNNIPLLSLIVWLPIFAGAGMLITARAHIWQLSAKFLPQFINLLTLVLLGYLIKNFALDTATMQFVEHYAWLPAIGVEYALGTDGFAILLVALTVFMTTLVLVAALSQVTAKDYVAYCANFLIMQGLMCGVFLALDAVLFFVFFEAMMIPMFLIIGIWGGPNRIYATIKFILYTLFGSLFLFVSLLYLQHLAFGLGYTGADSFAISTFQAMPIPFADQKWLFWAMLFAFAVKIPMWPVHTWLPDAHVEAPTGGSIILAAITLKIGAYGMLRWLLPIAPLACAAYANIVIALSLIAIVYIGLVAIVQLDLKKLIAYSSVAHMGFVTLGLFVAFKVLSMNNGAATAALGIEGAVIQMISHGFISGALFLCVGVLYVRMHSRKISDYGGVVNSMPIFATYFMLFVLANVGMPGTSGFVGEYLVILASFKASVWFAFLASTALVLSVAYTLWMYKRVVFGVTLNDAVAALRDINIYEKSAFALLAFAVLLFGLWPNPLLNMLHSSTTNLVTQLAKP